MIVLTLPYPISANRYWASRVVKINGKQMPMVYVTSEAKEYRKAAATIAAAVGIHTPLQGRVGITVRLYPNRPQDFRTRQRKLGAAWDDGVMCIDLDNANKVLLDALKGVAFEDDKWVRRLSAERMEPDDKGARVVVTVQALPVEMPQHELLEEAA